MIAANIAKLPELRDMIAGGYAGCEAFLLPQRISAGLKRAIEAGKQLAIAK